MSGVCQKIDFSSWPRREIFSFFSSLDQPFYSVCFRVDVTRLHAYTKAHGLSFYYAMTYLVAHGVDQVIFFRAEIFIFIQHGNAVKQMASLNHERHQKCLHGRKRGEQHAHGDKFQTSAVDHGTHNHRIPEGKSGRAHLNAIGHRKEPEAREDRHGIGKRRAQRGEFAVFISL